MNRDQALEAFKAGVGWDFMGSDVDMMGAFNAWYNTYVVAPGHEQPDTMEKVLEAFAAMKPAMEAFLAQMQPKTSKPRPVVVPLAVGDKPSDYEWLLEDVSSLGDDVMVDMQIDVPGRPSRSITVRSGELLQRLLNLPSEDAEIERLAKSLDEWAFIWEAYPETAKSGQEMAQAAKALRYLHWFKVQHEALS